MDEMQSQIGLGLLVVFVLQWLKGQKWFPFVSFDSQRINRIIGIVVAAAASWGIVGTFDYGTGTLNITGLTPDHLWSWAQHAGYQWLIQQAAYRGIVAPALPGAQQATRRELEAPKEK